MYTGSHSVGTIYYVMVGKVLRRLHVSLSATWSIYRNLKKIKETIKIGNYINLFIFIKHNPFPLPQVWQTSCHEMSYSKRETKLMKEKNNRKFPLYAI